MRTIGRRLRSFGIVAILLVLTVPTRAQTETATVSGRVTDAQDRVVPEAQIQLINIDTNIAVTTKTNSEGLYVISNVHPGQYRILVLKDGFKEIVKTGLVLHVQDIAAENFSLQIGSVTESVTVTANTLNINTTDATVSTVVDRQFAENLPLNGRSFQTLIELAPGVVVVPSGVGEAGQFSVNGQRSSSNYWMVDGVSANIGVSATNIPGNGLAGALGSFGAQGGTNSLVSVDALQEFRIQTSTYAPEFGRTPGAQISIVTRSGANQFHGTLFDYFRNDALDANDWFAKFAGLPKAQERQNDFGGTFSGPILKDRTFFFFSYEGLRLRLPQTELTTVPCDSTCKVFGNARTMAIPAVQPFLNAFPLPNGPEVFTPCTSNVNGCPPSGQQSTGTAQFNASYSNPATLDAYSLRVDHKLTDKLNVFGRYNYSPSEITNRGASSTPLSTVAPTRITTQTGTLGATWILSTAITNDLRFNYSRTDSSSTSHLDNFGGAVPPTALPFPSPFTTSDSIFAFFVIPLKNGRQLIVGRQSQNLQRQLNLVEGLSIQKGQHSLKCGIDYRRLSPVVDPALYNQEAFFLDMPSTEAGNLFFSTIESARSSTLLFRNLGIYAQDTWHVAPRLTVTYGLRWDVDFAPASLSGPNLPAVTGYNLNNLSQLALAPVGTTPFNTRYGNVAPRLGVAYSVSEKQGWQTVLRGGFGVFYDLVTSGVGTLISSVNYPFGGFSEPFGGTFPLDPVTAAPPPIEPPNTTNGGILAAFDPHIKAPYTLQWNVAVEQGVGSQQSISASYVGSSGRRLLQTADIFNPNPNLSQAELVGKTAASNYNALQLQFQRRLSHGLQGLASYTWSHSIDDGSTGAAFIASNTFVPMLRARANRGPSDFDIRHNFSLGMTYDIPIPKINRFTDAGLHGWSVQNFLIAFSAPPVDIFYDAFSFGSLFNSLANVRPDVVPGQPFYLSGSQCVSVLGPPCAGGKGLNPAAFKSPSLDPSTGNPLRQGNLGRNALRGFGATQWDFAVHRDFPIRESVKLQFRAEMFNVLNHPNLGPPVGDLGSPQALLSQFGQSQTMLGQSLSGAGQFGSVGNGSFSPLYQIGGPRSVQLALKLQF
jgi:hypothetical protein